MPLLRPCFFAFLGLSTFSCGSAGSSVEPGETRSCTEDDSSCPDDYTCRVDVCIPNGDLQAGDTCTREAQCAQGLTCYDLLCLPGCTRVFRLDDCIDQSWCKPYPDAGVVVGYCAQSECDPSTTEFCEDGSVCAAFAEFIGGCLTYCDYTVATGVYQDFCIDRTDTDYACQPVGLNAPPVCLGSGTLNVGLSGCDPAYRPCRPGNACIDTVCRELCKPDETDVCDEKEACVAVRDRTDVAYCRPD